MPRRAAELQQQRAFLSRGKAQAGTVYEAAKGFSGFLPGRTRKFYGACPGLACQGSISVWGMRGGDAYFVTIVITL
jgi:hypothetical protein